MTILIIVLFTLSLGYLLGIVHSATCDLQDSLLVPTLVSLFVCIALLIPLIYQVGRWAGFWG